MQYLVRGINYVLFGILLNVAVGLVLTLGVPSAVGQTTSEYIQDKNCSDFDSVVQAQGTFLAAQTTTRILETLDIGSVSYQRDYHGLDSDGNGIACEGIDVVKRREYTNQQDSVTHWINFHSHVYEVNCPTVDQFYMHNFERQARRAPVDTVLYNGTTYGFMNRMECLHTLGVIEQTR